MSSINEAASQQQNSLESILKQGLQVIAQDQVITFVRYVKLVLPLDGYIFWVKGDLVSPSATFNKMGFNQSGFNQGIGIDTPAQTINVKGSLHRVLEKIQDETKSFGLTKVIFTSEEPVHADFKRINPHCIYIAEFDKIKFTFSNTKHLYQQAGIWHYYGEAIYPYMESQIIDKLSGFNSKQLVVSNSLPAWLNLNNYTPIYTTNFSNTIPLYPSRLVEPNIVPPFGVVHIIPGSSEGLQSTPFLTKHLSHFQQTKEKVEVTLFGLNNDAVMNFIDCVNQYSNDYNLIGMLNVPIVQDNKMIQNELFTLAMSKTITYEVSYTQHSMRNLARQIICRAIPSFGIISSPVSTTVLDSPIFQGN